MFNTFFALSVVLCSDETLERFEVDLKGELSQLEHHVLTLALTDFTGLPFLSFQSLVE